MILVRIQQLMSGAQVVDDGMLGSPQKPRMFGWPLPVSFCGEPIPWTVQSDRIVPVSPKDHFHIGGSLRPLCQVELRLLFGIPEIGGGAGLRVMREIEKQVVATRTFAARCSSHPDDGVGPLHRFVFVQVPPFEIHALAEIEAGNVLVKAFRIKAYPWIRHRSVRKRVRWQSGNFTSLPM